MGFDKLEVRKNELISQFNSNPTYYSQGKFKFEQAIYGDGLIRDKLKELQFGKCCFCERKLDAAEVEHFRPKSSYKPTRNEKEKFPGYYSLAYSWDNLLLVCRGCNLNKSNIFPLSHEKNRAVLHTQDHNREMPLLINPAVNRPRRYLHFVGATVVPKNKSLMGIRTIEILKLNRPALEEERRDHIVMIEALKMVARLTPNGSVSQENIDNAKKKLEFYRCAQSRFSAMVSDFLW